MSLRSSVFSPRDRAPDLPPGGNIPPAAHDGPTRPAVVGSGREHSSRRGLGWSFSWRTTADLGFSVLRPPHPSAVPPHPTSSMPELRHTSASGQVARWVEQIPLASGLWASRCCSSTSSSRGQHFQGYADKRKSI
uniref:Predicted protein n=1 Tax=Hordeum vulgare subsp. vulgare TaxID=112509 RepID=F2CXF6_HORVV|nr:predicted protein [Hordeum vulgare subsp. vulgare]